MSPFKTSHPERRVARGLHARSRKSFLLLTLLTALSALPALSQAETLYVTADTMFTSGPAGVIENAALVVENGTISAVGPAADIAVPAGARSVEAAVVLPGLIDSHTVVGVNGAWNIPADQDGFEASDAAGAEYRVLDSFNPLERLVSYALSMGATTLHVTPQPTAPIAGSSAIFKSRGQVADDMLLKADAAMLFNLGAAPKSAFADQGGPSTRMATAALIREQFYAARHWAAEDEDDRKPDLAMSALARVLSGETKAVFTAHREDDIATALRIAAEFDLEPVIAYGTEAFLMRPLLAAANATVILAPPMQRVSGMERWNSTLEAAALLGDGDVSFVLATGYEAYVPKSRVLLWETGMAAANGLSRERAISSVTIDAARLWGIEDRVGSLEVGKDADLVLFNGDPLEYTTLVEHVIIDGELVTP